MGGGKATKSGTSAADGELGPPPGNIVKHVMGAARVNLKLLAMDAAPIAVEMESSAAILMFMVLWEVTLAS
jgi:hypothetical protein